MTPEQIQALIDLIRGYGEMALTKGFELAMLEVQVRIAQNLLWLVIGAALVAATVRLGLTGKQHMDNDYRYDDGSGWFFIAAICGFLGIGAVVASASALLGLVMNPEWRAIEILLRTAGGG